MCPYFTFKQVLTPAEWVQCFQQKQDYLGFTPLNPSNVLGDAPIMVTSTGGVLHVACSTFTTGLAGCVPASGGGTTNFLRADGSWASPPSSGAMTVGTTPTSGAAVGALFFNNTGNVLGAASAPVKAWDIPAWNGTTWVTLGNLTNTFWNPSAKIQRLPDRVFMGAAVGNNGSSSPCAADWFSVLEVANLGGCDSIFAQTFTLFDINSAPGSMAVPTIGHLIANSNINNIVGSTPRTLETITFNNSTLAANMPMWGHYNETYLIGNSTGNTYNEETELITTRTLSKWDPYQTPGAGLIGKTISCGGGGVWPGTLKPCTAGLQFGANPQAFMTGILVFPGSVLPDGPGGIKPFLDLPYDHCLAWYLSAGTLAGSMCYDVSGNLHLNASGAIELSSNTLVPDGSVFGWGATTSYMGGSSALNFINFVTAGVERGKVKLDGGLTWPDTVPGGSKGSGTINVSGDYYVNGVADLIPLAAPLPLYVGGTGNSDSNDCLAATVTGGHGPCATIQHGYDLFQSTYNCKGFEATINVADGGYAAGLNITTAWTGGCQVSVIGNMTTPANVVVTASLCFAVGAPLPAVLTVNGFKCASSNFGVLMNSLGILNIANIEFAPTTTTGTNMAANITGGTIQCVGALKMSASNSVNSLAQGGTVACAGQNITLTGSPVFANGWAVVSALGSNFWNGAIFSGGTGAGSLRFSASSNGIVFSGGIINCTTNNNTYLPGTVAGSCATGGQAL